MRIVIYGAGGLGRQVRRQVLADTERLGWDGPVFTDDDPGCPTTLLGLPVIAPGTMHADDRCVLAVGSGLARRRLVRRCPGFHALIAPTAIIDDGVTFGLGALICDQSILTADRQTVIGRHFQCNFQSYIGHDCRIGDFVTLSPRVGVNGNVHIGDNVFVGAGALIRSGMPGRRLMVGDGATIGMGAVVTEDVAPGATVVGNPARPISPPGCFRTKSG